MEKIEEDKEQKELKLFRELDISKICEDVLRYIISFLNVLTLKNLRLSSKNLKDIATETLQKKSEMVLRGEIDHGSILEQIKNGEKCPFARKFETLILSNCVFRRDPEDAIENSEKEVIDYLRGVSAFQCKKLKVFYDGGFELLLGFDFYYRINERFHPYEDIMLVSNSLLTNIINQSNLKSLHINAFLACPAIPDLRERMNRDGVPNAVCIFEENFLAGVKDNNEIEVLQIAGLFERSGRGRSLNFQRINKVLAKFPKLKKIIVSENEFEQNQADFKKAKYISKFEPNSGNFIKKPNSSVVFVVSIYSQREKRTVEVSLEKCEELQKNNKEIYEESQIFNLETQAPFLERIPFNVSISNTDEVLEILKNVQNGQISLALENFKKFRQDHPNTNMSQMSLYPKNDKDLNNYIKFYSQILEAETTSFEDKFYALFFRSQSHLKKEDHEPALLDFNMLTEKYATYYNFDITEKYKRSLLEELGTKEALRIVVNNVDTLQYTQKENGKRRRKQGEQDNVNPLLQCNL